MKKLIFTVYFDIEESKLDSEDYNKNLFTKNQLNYYQSHLTLNKISYSKRCESDFILFDDREDLDNFKKNFDSDISLYTVINFYKLHLLDKLADEYDNILFLDQDVYIDTSKNIFETLDNNLHIWHENTKKQVVEYLNFYKEKELYSRSYINKSISSYCTSFTFDWPVNFNKYNTGIIYSNKENIKRLNFQENFNFLVANYKQICYNKDLPENIRSKFTLNNEAFISNIIQKEKIEVKNLPQSWHHILNHESVLEDYKNSESFFYHFINKEFSWILSV